MKFPSSHKRIGFKVTPYTLKFKTPATTSRQTMTEKRTCMVEVWDLRRPEIRGRGECALFEGLSAEDTGNFPAYCRAVEYILNRPDREWPRISSLRFGLETAMADLAAGGKGVWVDNAFTRGEITIPINGLIWMGTREEMRRRLREKLDAGFRCIKLKIGGIDFDEELELLKFARDFAPADLELRLDANGAFTPENALERLQRLSEFRIHSIEQPIRAGQPDAMAEICSRSPIPVALDEELIGFTPDEAKLGLLKTVRPHYIILKPSLCGGFREADSWISVAEGLGIGWWATSALESNIGLNAIAQWVSEKNVTIPQGLGTGALYTNNLPSRLHLNGDTLRFV